jgi:hypothetical protein
MLVVQGFKSHYFNAVFGMWSEAEKSAHKDLPAAARSLNFRSPLDILFWYSVANNVCSIFGLAGVLAAQRVIFTGLPGARASGSALFRAAHVSVHGPRQHDLL